MTDVQIFHNYPKRTLVFRQVEQHPFQLSASPPSPRSERSLRPVLRRWDLQPALGTEPVGTEPEKRSDL